MVSCGKDDDGNDLNVRDNELAGSISGHLELDPELEYYLTGPLIVEEGGVLDIPAGTVIKDIYIYDGADDGIGFFGGSVNVTNLARQMQDLIKVRRGAKAVIVNALVKGSGAVGDLIDLTDGKDYGDLGSQISLTNMLDNAIDGSEIKPADAEAIVVESGNIGCDSKLFSWTGYEF